MKKKNTAPRGTLTHEVATRLREAIVNAEFDFGENLSEDLIASALNVSRAPVRSALKMLEFEGLVRIIPKSGSYVLRFTEEDIKQLIDFRSLLETNALALIPVASFKPLSEELASYLQVMQQAIDQDDMRLYGRADSDFHLAIVRVSDNKYLTSSYQTILGIVATLRTHLAQKAKGEPLRSYRDHQEITRLFSLGNAKKVDDIRKLLTKHISQTNQNYFNAFKSEMMPDLMRMKKRLNLLGNPPTK